MFGSQQQSVTLYFGPSAVTHAIDGIRTNPSGSEVSLSASGDASVDVLANPDPAEPTFLYDLTQVDPRSSASGSGPSGLRIVKTRLVFTVTHSDSDPDGLPIIPVPTI